MDTQRFSRIANGLKSASISSVTQTADALRREGKEVLVFSIGRPDFDTPEHIKAAANDALAKGFVHYTHNRGILPMREAVAAYLKRQNGLDYDPKTEIMITAGAQEALMLCTHALLDPGDEVLVPSPGFLLYYSSIPMLHAVPVPYVLKEPGYDWDGAPVSDRTKLMIFNNPNNPTGTTLTKPELKKWVDYALANDTLILFDAAYEAFIREDDVPHSIYEIKGAKKCAIEFRSFSKTAGFTGVRCGYTVVPKELTAATLEGERIPLNKLWNRRQSTKFNGTSYITQRAAEAIYTPEGQRQIKETIDYYMDNARTMKQGLEAAELKVYGGVNAPYIWLKTPDGTSSWRFFEQMLYEANVVGTPGVGFGPSGEGYIRLTAFGKHEDCVEAMKRIRKWLK